MLLYRVNLSYILYDCISIRRIYYYFAPDRKNFCLFLKKGLFINCLKFFVMKVIIEHIHTHDQLRFSSLKELNHFLNNKVFWNAQSFRIWSVYRVDGGKKTEFGKGILNLLHYVLHYKLLLS